MAKTTGGVRGAVKSKGMEGSDIVVGVSKIDVSKINVGSIKEIKDRALQKDIQQAISKFESRLGVKHKVELADLNGAYGVHIASGIDGKTVGIYLDRNSFKTKEQVINAKEKAYKSGFSNKTNKPTQHTVVHELSHAVWNSHQTSVKSQKAGREIYDLYKTFKKRNPKSWGSYGKTNINEFYAEGITKGVLGKSDKYTKSLIKITKKYGL